MKYVMYRAAMNIDHVKLILPGSVHPVSVWLQLVC